MDKRDKQQDRKLYPAVCDTCGLDIQVPFKPDGTRPTFCKECLKDYQRAMAKGDGGDAPVQPRSGRNIPSDGTRSGGQHGQQGRQKKDVQRMVYTPQDAPMSLSQFQHVGPKKFKTIKKRPEIDLEGVRDLIGKDPDNDNTDK